MTTTKTPVSPKVIFGGFVAGLVTLLLTSLTAITPTTFDFLGKWSPLVYGAVILASYAITAWWTADPLRLKPEDQIQKPTQTPPADSVVVNAPATVALSPVTTAAATSFADTQAKIDAALALAVTTTPEPAPVAPVVEPAAVTPVYTPPIA